MREKLVRDLGPSLIAGDSARLRSAVDAEAFRLLLIRKLHEEVAEFTSY